MRGRPDRPPYILSAISRSPSTVFIYVDRIITPTRSRGKSGLPKLIIYARIHKRRRYARSERPVSIPHVVIERLPLYLRSIRLLSARGESIASSQDLAGHLGLSSAQIRKDLSYFGEFGKQGMGYDLAYLREQLERILQVDQVWSIALVGAGALGQALANYAGFRARGFQIGLAFDSDPAKIGQRLGALEVQGIYEMPSEISNCGIEIAILAVPAAVAQEVAEQLVAAGVKAILNYAPVSLSLPDDVQVQHIDPAALLQSMTYYLDK
jgi:redox-sensing transcriptional repressor